jgi:hypothetical protein
MGIEEKRIHVVGDNQNHISNLSNSKEEVIIFIIQPDFTILTKILQIHFGVTSAHKEVESNIIFIPGESYNII